MYGGFMVRKMILEDFVMFMVLGVMILLCLVNVLWCLMLDLLYIVKLVNFIMFVDMNLYVRVLVMFLYLMKLMCIVFV